MNRRDESSAPTARRLQLADLLLAETTRVWEKRGEAGDTAAADTAGRERGGDFATRIVARARALPAAPRLTEAIRQVRQATALIVIGLCALGLIAGAGAARAALGAPRDAPVNFFAVLGTLLGVQTLLLLIWIALMSRGPAALASGSIGGAALAMGRWLTRRLHHGPAQLAAIEAVGAVVARGPLARWNFSSITHGVWVSFNVGCIVLVILLLSARRYTFGWETTILSADTYVPLTRVIAWLPERAGFRTPSAEEIRASEWTGDGLLPDSASEQWSGLLVGALIVYGLAPRMLLLGLSLGRRRAARGELALDTTLPGYVRLQPALMPTHERLGVVDPAPPEDGVTDAPPGPEVAPRPTGPPAILGLEVDPPQAPWPPMIHGVQWLDMGFIETRDDRLHACRALAEATTEPLGVVVACALTTTPDRGHTAFLRGVTGAVSRPAAVLLTAGDALRRRGEARNLGQRIEDWRAAATAAGIAADRVVQLDLDHLTDESAGRIRSLLGVSDEQPGATGGRNIERAFDLIVQRTGAWHDAVDAATRAELHRAIAGLYRAHGHDPAPLWAPGGVAALARDAVGELRTSADRVTALLPERLRRSPRWLAAGAATGALGCVAAAALLSPAAIAALPMWSALGAALGAVIQPTPRVPDADDDEGPAVAAEPVRDAIRSAALFALLLELQGHPETRITSLLDAAIGADADEPRSIAQTRSWLDGVRHRLDTELARGERA